MPSSVGTVGVGLSPPFPPPSLFPPLLGLVGLSGFLHPAAMTTANISIMAAKTFVNLFIFDLF